MYIFNFVLGTLTSALQDALHNNTTYKKKIYLYVYRVMESTVKGIHARAK